MAAPVDCMEFQSMEVPVPILVAPEMSAGAPVPVLVAPEMAAGDLVPSWPEWFSIAHSAIHLFLQEACGEVQQLSAGSEGTFVVRGPKWMTIWNAATLVEVSLQTYLPWMY